MILFRIIKILLVTGLTFIYANVSCPKNELIDFVESNGGSWIECVPTVKALNFKPDISTYILKSKPKIYKHKNRTLYIFDLSKNGKFFNASAYGTLEIDGKYKGSTVAFADRNYFKQDDNYPVVMKDNKINIPALFSHIDIRFLKYLIIIVPKDRVAKIDKIEFIKRDTKYKDNLKFATWVWNPKNVDLNIIKRDDVNRVYLQIRSGFKTFLEKNPNIKKEIFGLDGSPTNILEFKHLEKDILYLSKLKKRGFPIVGFQIDVEPYLLKGFANTRDAYYRKYIDMVKKLSKLAHKNGLKFSVVMPFWFDSTYVDNKSISSYVVDLTDETVLMSYRSNPDKVIDISEDILAYAEYKGKKVRIGMEMKKIADEKHSLYRRDTISPCITNGTFQKDCTLLDFIRSYEVKGSSISFYKQYNNAKELIKKVVPYKSFNGFVIHGYKSLNKL